MDNWCAKVQITNNAAAVWVSVFIARKGALAYFWLTFGGTLVNLSILV